MEGFFKALQFIEVHWENKNFTLPSPITFYFNQSTCWPLASPMKYFFLGWPLLG